MFGTKRFSRGNHLVSALLVGGFALIAAVIVFNRQCVIDHLIAWQYHPSSAVVALADRTTMNGDGRFFFYASQPAIESSQKFNQECGRKESGTAILGCYNGRNIYIYNVTDSKLDGIKEVTAAHEMLHAAYARLSGNEKRSLDSLLETEYQKLNGDKDFSDRMAFYARTEPGERDNELHSVIGTEVATISPGLETYYKKYFNDRAKIVALHNQYASVFDDLQAKSEQLSSQLTALGDQIESESAQYNTDVTKLNAAIASFNDRANSDGFSSAGAFQNERDSLVAQANELDATRRAINDDIAQYDTLREELSSIASQSQALNKSIDSSLAPAPSL
jgi:chaperonin cofactor prefoldin